MALLKFLRRPSDSPPPGAGAPTAAAEAVQAARQQARRRLIGAIVLLGIGVLGFPLVFQTQPRPIPVDIPIEIPKRDGVGPLAGGGLSPAAGGTQSKGLASDPARPASAGSTTESSATATASASSAASTEPHRESSPGASSASKTGTAAGTAATAATAATMPRDVEVEVLGSAAPPKPQERSGGAADAIHKDAKEPKEARDPRDSNAAGAVDKLPEKGRFVVQAGSYTDADTVREVRAKLERLGLKTYTQAVQIDGVARTRVRVGPYASKQEALEVQNKIKAAGVSAALLAL